MSEKINVCDIIKGHYSTLRDYSSEKISIADISLFILLPVIISLANVFFSLTIGKELRAALINFGAIFTALLISVLVLVYDQRNKLNSLKDIDQSLLPNYKAMKQVFKELYNNICFAILVSLTLVVFSMLQIVTVDLKLDSLNIYLVNPIVVFSICTVILTTLMIIKRLHKLLSTFDRIANSE